MPFDRDEDKHSKHWDDENKHSRSLDRHESKRSKPWDREDKAGPWDREEDMFSKPCNHDNEESSKFSDSDDDDDFPMKLPFLLMHQPFGTPSRHQGFPPFPMWGAHPSFPFHPTKFGDDDMDRPPMHGYGFQMPGPMGPMDGPMRPPMFGPPMRPLMFGPPMRPPMFGPQMNGPMRPSGPQMDGPMRPPMFGPQMDGPMRPSMLALKWMARCALQ